MAAALPGGMDQPLLQGQQDNFLHANSTQRVVTIGRKQPYSSRRYIFLVLHYGPFLAQLWLMRTAFKDGDRLILGCTMAALAFSGLFYAFVSWSATVPGLFGKGFLPLRKQPLPFAMLLMVPYGFLQWVILNLHVRSAASEAAGPGGEEPERGADEERGAGGEDSPGGHALKDSEIVSIKAINAIVESILTSAAILYTHWTKGISFRISTAPSLIICPIVIVASGGLGLLQVDFCCSRSVRGRMKDSDYMWLHGFFRTCEVTSRLSILTGFAVMATAHSSWWWVLIFIELAISTYLVLAHGGMRNTAVAVAICVVSATIVNVFCFVDSPLRFEQAHNISRGLTLKHAAETILAFFFMFFVMDVRLDFSLHGASLGTAVAATVAYWVLWVPLVRLRWGSEPDPSDNLFSACQRGDAAGVKRLIWGGEVQFDLDELDVSGLTPLMHAAEGGHAAICRELLQRGASLALRAQSGEGHFVQMRRHFWEPVGRKWSALHFAAWQGHVEALRELLHRVGHDQVEIHEAVDVDGNTPLHVASIFGRVEAFEVIWTVGPTSWRYILNGSGSTPRHPRGRGTEDIEAGAVPGPQQANDPDAPAAEEYMVPYTGAPQVYEVPLGLSSFMVCASSAQVGDAFLPQPVIDLDRQRGGARAGGLRFDQLDPCGMDGVAVPGLNRQNYLTWRDPRVYIAKGSFGLVGRARDQDGNLYAVKLMKKEQPMHHCAALREAQVALAVRDHPHPCLVKVFLYHELEEHICVITRYCNWGTLHGAIVERAMRLQRTGAEGSGFCEYYQYPPCALRWIAQAFLGIEYVHKKMGGSVRDVKPANIGLMKPEAAPPGPAWEAPVATAMLLDFGSIRLTGPSTGRGSFGCDTAPCSRGYAAPEILMRRPNDYHVDLYSLGVTIWVLLTGGKGPKADPPFNRDNLVPKLSEMSEDWRELRDIVERPAKYRVPELPPAALRLIRGLTDYRPHRRLGHDAIRDQLRELLVSRLPDLPMLPDYEAPQAEIEAWLSAP